MSLSTDPISDLLARIRNAQMARHETVSIPHSKAKLGLVKVLYEEGYIGPYRVASVAGVKDASRKEIVVTLRFIGKHQGLISGLVRESKPGRRYYIGYRKIRSVRSGMGLTILTTPKGILTDKQAREEKVGGEVLCRIW